MIRRDTPSVLLPGFTVNLFLIVLQVAGSSVKPTDCHVNLTGKQLPLTFKSQNNSIAKLTLQRIFFIRFSLRKRELYF